MRNLLVAFFLLCLPATSSAIDDSLEGNWYFLDPGNHLTCLSFARGKLTVYLSDTTDRSQTKHIGFVASYTLKPGGVVHFTLDPVPNPISGPEGDYHYKLLNTKDREGGNWNNLRIPELFSYDTTDPNIGIWFRHFLPSK